MTARESIPLEPGDSEHPLLKLFLSAPAPVQGRGERAQRLQKALSQLPEEYRRVIDLFYVDGLSHDTIAQETGRSPENVRELLVRALARLGRILSE